MIRGLVSATNALTRAPNGRWPRLLLVLLVPSAPGGRDSTAVTHTPEEDSSEPQAVHLDVKSR
ncbi:hypothetical protein GCM10010431_02490 [Streptomyces kunmingensis]